MMMRGEKIVENLEEIFKDFKCDLVHFRQESKQKYDCGTHAGPAYSTVGLSPPVRPKVGGGQRKGC